MNKTIEQKDLIKKFVPNPMDSGSTLPGLSQKSEVLIETLSFTAIIINIIIFIVIGFVLLSFFRVPFNIISILIGFEIFSSLLIAYIKYLKIKSLSAMAPRADGESFKKIAVTKEYYNLLSSIVCFCASAIFVGLILLFFGQQLLSLIGGVCPLTILRGLAIAENSIGTFWNLSILTNQDVTPKLAITVQPK